MKAKNTKKRIPNNRTKVVEYGIGRIFESIIAIEYAFCTHQTRLEARHKIKITLQDIYDRGVIRGKKLAKEK